MVSLGRSNLRADYQGKGVERGAHCSGIWVMSAVWSAEAFSWMAAQHNDRAKGQSACTMYNVSIQEQKCSMQQRCVPVTSGCEAATRTKRRCGTAWMPLVSKLSAV